METPAPTEHPIVSATQYTKPRDKSLYEFPFYLADVRPSAVNILGRNDRGQQCPLREILPA
jgi:hypothetical protein